MIESTKDKIREMIREASTVWVASVDKEGYPAVNTILSLLGISPFLSSSLISP